jgi:hypothetical protein
MSVSTEVQRTLVKSPPELWSELSDPHALARHLVELGEIRITSVEPETKVEWEAAGANGVVHLKQSGWGTKVTLSVTRNPPAAEEPSQAEAEAEPQAEPVAVVEPPVAEVEPIAEPEPIPEPVAAVEADPEPAAVEPEPIAKPESDAAPEPEPAATTEPEPIAEPEPEPQLGFLARLFRRRKARPHEIAAAQPQPEATTEPEIEPEIEEVDIEVVALAGPEPIYSQPSLEPTADLAAELEAVEAQMTQETTELLMGVLDRLGAAHHRPFSRG